ncbi:MAG TPA: putative toxin-antitoxin system toxin component, PIN family [Pirellulaceae bacterium]|nr:putative toxin-antitoxin system toxin component, PIN family [Pirellulaceae bacterium]
MVRKPLIVIDTNVLVSALRSNQGWSFQLLSRMGGETLDHCVSAPLLLEYEEVLKRGAVPLGLEVVEIDDLVDRLAETGRKCLIHFEVGPVTPAQDDEMVLELAVSASCSSSP